MAPVQRRFWCRLPGNNSPSAPPRSCAFQHAGECEALVVSVDEALHLDETWNLFWQEHHSSKIMLLDVFWSPDLETLWRRPQHPRFDVVCSDKKLGGRPGYAEITSLTEIKLDVLKYRNHVMYLCANREEYNIIQYYIFVFHKACVVASQPDLHFRILSVDSRVPRDSKEIHVRVSFQNCGIALHYITRVHVYERIHVYSLVLCLLLVMHIV